MYKAGSFNTKSGGLLVFIFLLHHDDDDCGFVGLQKEDKIRSLPLYIYQHAQTPSNQTMVTLSPSAATAFSYAIMLITHLPHLPKHCFFQAGN